MSISYKLEELGWNSFFQDQLNTLDISDKAIGRISTLSHNIYEAFSEKGTFSLTLSGKLSNAINNDECDTPSVGDWILFVNTDTDKGVITNILKRKTELFRKSSGTTTYKQTISSNSDFIFIVTGLDKDFSIHRIERYLALSWQSGAKPVIILNKSDLCSEDELRQRIIEVELVAIDVEIHCISALENINLDQLNAYLRPGKTVTLIGSSGSGKSTLINRLCKEDVQRTGSVRDSDNRGRHTTVRRSMIILPNKSILIDNPGIREVHLFTDEESLDAAFSDIDELAEGCKFNDCQHQGEPDCAVQEALMNGTLMHDRYFSYLKLRKEQAFYEDETHQRKRNFEKKISKFQKQLKKYNPKY